MKTISSALKQAIINGKVAVLFKITTKDNAIYAYTDHDMPLTVGSVTYQPTPGLKKIYFQSTTDGTAQNNEVAAGWSINDESLVISGKFDYAEVEVSLVDWSNVSLGTVLIDRGNLTEINFEGNAFRAVFESYANRLKKNINFIVTANCRHLLFSQFSSDKIGACTVNQASYTYNGTVSTIVTPKLVFTVSGLSQPNAWCSGGVLTWTTGNNAGLSYVVKNHEVSASTTITLFLPTLGSIQVGDQFSVTAGCDKTLNTCKNKFNNVLNFGGFPHLQTGIGYR